MIISELVPETIVGWESDDEDALYDKETIFRYMNGAGEVYLSYHYKELFVRRFQKEGEEEIVVELYDMGNSSDAFGIFARSREGKDVGIGQGSEFRSGFLIFWKDKYFVTVYTLSESKSSNETVLQISKLIADNIVEVGELPTLLELLPEEKLAEYTTRFFHKYTDLNQHYFVADENILNLGLQTDAVLANYSIDENYPFLLVVDYGTAEAATNAFSAFVSAYMPEAKQAGMIQIEDGLWSAARNYGNYVVAVFDAGSGAAANDLINRVTVKIDEVSK